MKPEVLNLCKELEIQIQRSYEESLSIEEIEKLAARFLQAEITIINELRNVSLDSKMRKSGLKSIRAAAYLNEATKTDKKPTEKHIESVLELDKTIASAQNDYDTSEVDCEQLAHYLRVFDSCHVFYRQQLARLGG